MICIPVMIGRQEKENMGRGEMIESTRQQKCQNVGMPHSVGLELCISTLESTKPWFTFRIRKIVGSFLTGYFCLFYVQRLCDKT